MTDKEKILTSHGDLSAKIIRDSKNIPDKTIDAAQLKIVQFKSLEKEINAEMVAVLKQAIAIKKKINLNLQTEDNPEGLLTHPELEYFKCLEVDYVNLKNLLEMDSQYWTKNLQKAKKGSQKLQQ